MIEWLKLLYGWVGVDHPYLSSVVAAGVGALLLGGAWYSVGVAYRQDHAKEEPANVSVMADPTVTIQGPAQAPLGRTTYFTILSKNAVRAVWSAGGFGRNRPFYVEPLAPSHQIYLKPTDAARIGDTFIISVTVYGPDGRSATATKQFLVVR
jgi:hypothetical protein